MRFGRRRLKISLVFLAVVSFCIYVTSYFVSITYNVETHDNRRVLQREASSYHELAHKISKHSDLKWNKYALEIIDAARHYDFKGIEDILRKRDMKTKMDESPNASRTDNHSLNNKAAAPMSEKMAVNLSAPGEMGRPFIVSPEDQAEVDRLYPINDFNLFASDRISLNRSLPDVRPNGCSDLTYPTNLPDTSLVIIFHNEAWSTLWRTVHSAINRSPAYLKEIILVDDASTQDHLKSKVDDYARRLKFNVRIIRVTQRVGLIQAKQIGFNSATGEIVVFMDSHCEAMEGWLEPLVFRIAQNRSHVAIPVIDNINDNTFKLEPYAPPPPQGVFTWKLRFNWLNLREDVQEEWKKNTTMPIRSPVMAGGLFAIDKSFFNELGGYDDGLKIWGGEHMDLSFKTWMCGGILEIIPCSHVAHIQRNHNKPYKDHKEGDYQSKNDKRIAEIWMEPEYKNFFYYVYPSAQKAEMGDISRSLRIRKRCKSFRWYLENVFNETGWPTKHSIFGQINNLQSRNCLESGSGERVVMYPCQARDIYNLPQLWSFTDRGEIKHDHLCLDWSGSGNVVMYYCNFRGGNQKWFYRKEARQIVHTNGQCLDSTQDRNAGTWILTVSVCDPQKQSQKWQLQMKPWNEWYKDYEQSRNQSLVGQVKNLESDHCLESQTGNRVAMFPCQARGIHNIQRLWAFTDRGEIKHDHMCLDSPGGGNVVMFYCHFEGGNQKWFYRNETKQIVHTNGQCLDSIQDHGAGKWTLTVSFCDPEKQSQMWQLLMKPWNEWYKDYEQSRDQYKGA